MDPEANVHRSCAAQPQLQLHDVVVSFSLLLLLQVWPGTGCAGPCGVSANPLLQ
jgi:hypothetical protein